ncbi:MAG TPA: hypothetical protein VN802_15380 [Stellaceae bacterium]|nr:hypothetical protein [Stellaceae bacterium]
MLARQIAVGFGIAVVFPLLVYYAVAIFSPPPEFNYAALAVGPNASPEQRQQGFERQQEAQKAYAENARRFSRTLYFIAVPLGIAAIVGGLWVRPHAIGTGFLLGGIFTVGQGCYFHWAYLDNSLRFASLLLALLALLYAGRRVVTPATGVTAAP